MEPTVLSPEEEIALATGCYLWDVRAILPLPLPLFSLQPTLTLTTSTSTEAAKQAISSPYPAASIPALQR